MDQIFSPKLDQSIMTVLQQCPQCKNFRATHLHTLLDPITQRHPFELLVADYLSLPKGKGGYHTVLLILDTFSQYVWGYKLKVHGTGQTTVDGLKSIRQMFKAPETFMTDGGTHFNNGDVRVWCEANGTSHQVVAAYAPWVNGLVENANGKLLGQLKHLCSPELGEDEYQEVQPGDITNAWPDHFDVAIRHLNERIIPAFQFSPKELLLRFIVNTTCTHTDTAIQEPSPQDADVHLTYVEQQCLDAMDLTAVHTIKRKLKFDQRVILSRTGEVAFDEGQLVQVYDNAADMMFATSKKLLPRWSAPWRVVSRTGNSYQLEMLEGFPMNGMVHARRLRWFLLRDGTVLAQLEEDRGAAQQEGEMDGTTDKNGQEEEQEGEEVGDEQE